MSLSVYLSLSSGSPENFFKPLKVHSKNLAVVDGEGGTPLPLLLPSTKTSFHSLTGDESKLLFSSFQQNFCLQRDGGGTITTVELCKPIT